MYKKKKIGYYKKNQTEPADYTMHGDPAGLGRIDDIFGFNFYTKAFTGNPLPWGAWPSLHSGFAVFTATFLSFLFPKFIPLLYCYVAWIWWATMYLGHHYFVDLLGGMIYALLCVAPACFYLWRHRPVNMAYEELNSIFCYETDNYIFDSAAKEDSERSQQQMIMNDQSYTKIPLTPIPFDDDLNKKHDRLNTVATSNTTNTEDNISCINSEKGLLGSTSHNNSNRSSLKYDIPLDMNNKGILGIKSGIRSSSECKDLNLKQKQQKMGLQSNNSYSNSNRLINQHQDSSDNSMSTATNTIEMVERNDHQTIPHLLYPISASENDERLSDATEERTAVEANNSVINETIHPPTSVNDPNHLNVMMMNENITIENASTIIDDSLSNPNESFSTAANNISPSTSTDSHQNNHNNLSIPVVVVHDQNNADERLSVVSNIDTDNETN